MIKVKTSDLVGMALDYCVDIAVRGGKPSNAHAFAWRYQNNDRRDYSTNWAHGGPLVENHPMQLFPYDWTGGPKWMAWVYVDRENRPISLTGGTLLIAICRAVVAAKIGREVDVPEELLRVTHEQMRARYADKEAD